MKKKKTKIINLPMKFNPGLQKFEPELPIKLNKKKDNRIINWCALIYFLLGIIFLILIIYFAFR